MSRTRRKFGRLPWRCALVLDVVPEAVEQIDAPAKLLAYGFAATYKDTICVIMPLKVGR